MRKPVMDLVANASPYRLFPVRSSEQKYYWSYFIDK